MPTYTGSGVDNVDNDDDDDSELYGEVDDLQVKKDE